MLGCGGNGSTPTGLVVAISPSTVQTLDAGQSTVFTATVTGSANQPAVTWQLQGPGVLSNESAQNVTYTAPTSLGIATSISIEALPPGNNGQGAETQINIFPALTIASGSAPAATIDLPYSLQLLSNGGAGTIVWSLATGSLPAGLSISTKGIISGTPTVYGTFSFVVSATDSATTPAVVTQEVTLVVSPSTLSISSSCVPNGVMGKAYVDPLAATGGIAPYIWTLAAGSLPPGLTLSGAGLLAGSPTIAGTYTYTVNVADTESNPQIAAQSCTIIVYSPLQVTGATLPNGEVGVSYSQTLQSTGGTGPIAWTVSSGVLPIGLSLASNGVISGTPTAAVASTVTIQATDASLPAQIVKATYTINVAAALCIATASLPNGTLNLTYTTSLVSCGGNPPVTWSIASGSLPTGLSLSAAGVISGTPSVAGPSNVTIAATDATPVTITHAFTLTVAALAPLAITTTTLPLANTGVSYSSSLAATGGAAPYTWTVAPGGTLPPGLTLSTGGVISGTPTALGSYGFTVEVTDSQSTPATATQALTIVVSNDGDPAALSGNYAFLLNGFAHGATPGAVYGFAAIGSLTADGKGNLTGVEDINTPAGAQLAQPVTGTYSVGVDGRGQMTLTAGTTVTSYAISVSQFVSGVAQYVAITEFDNSTGTGSVASGFAKAQTTAALVPGTLMGTYAFGLSGESPCNACVTPAGHFGPVVAVGIVTGDGISSLSHGLEDAGAYAASYTGVTLAGSYTAPSPTNGRGTMSLNPTGTLFSAPPTNYTYVIVSPSEFLLLSDDSHASSALLYGDAQLQQQTTYAAATEFSGRSIGYESQASGGDGATIFPSTLNALLYQLTNTGSGAATFFEDSNKAGTFATSPSPTAITYTTAANGRVAVTTGTTSSQVLYLFNTGAGFGIDEASSSGYPGLVQYELQVRTSASLPPFPVGVFASGTHTTPTAATVASGVVNFTLFTGGEDTNGFGGSYIQAIDSSTPAGTLTSDSPASFSTLQDSTGRQVATASKTSTTPLVITYVITGTRSASIPAVATTSPTVTILQQ